MQEMWQREVLPRLEASSGAVIFSRTLKTWGLSEGLVDELVRPYLSGGNPTLAMYARPDGINLRITAKAATEAAAASIVSAREKDIREIIGKNIWGVDNQTLEEIVGKLLAEAKMSLAVSESFTGGMLAYSLAGAPGSETYFKGGIILPAEAAEISEAAASEKAQAVRGQFGADIGLTVFGRCETSKDGTRSKACIAISAASGCKSIAAHYPGRPPLAIRRTINHALVYLMNYLK
jgi:nicotinamide-nucleotide amidase